MDFIAAIRDQWLLASALAFLLSSITVLVLNKRQRDAVLSRLRFRRRRSSEASTPPRSFSPATDTKEALPSSPDYKVTFPPSRRSAILELAEKASSKILIGTEPSVDLLVKDLLPTTRSYDLENETPKYTPTGFSTTEIEALGDFPAYDILSGVPLPEPYENFDPAKALPRPYRPLRWAYHQTMC